MKIGIIGGRRIGSAPPRIETVEDHDAELREAMDSLSEGAI